MKDLARSSSHQPRQAAQSSTHCHISTVVHLLARWRGIALACLCLLIVTVSKVKGQTTIELKRQLPSIQPDSTYFIGYWVLPETIAVTRADTLIPSRYWQYKQDTGNWSWRPEINELPTEGPILLTFQTYIYSLRRTYSNRKLVEFDTSAYEAGADTSAQKAVRSIPTSSDLFGDVQLQKSGSLTRGVIMGTNQDVALESGLRFDLSGQVTDDIDVLATLTDKSTPIQPDGSTQNLREFDKVFIQLSSDQGRLQLGDIDFSLDKSEFARLDRRLQGAGGFVETRYGDYKAAFSVARGEYRSMQFNGQDGLQGPYRLTGKNGEKFITVLAGTERVYINGERMKRGEQHDYVIDYGLGEIHFTNNRIITDNTRITVDFQYLLHDFNRTLLAAEAGDDSLLNGRLDIRATYVREADSDNLQSQAVITSREADILRQAGDDPTKAVTSGADSVGYQPDGAFNRVLYAKLDTVYQGETYQIYKHLQISSQNVYRVNFSSVGAGNGDYKRVGGAVNGILYEWVGPGNGSYAPVQQLPMPMKKQMVSIRSKYRLTPQLRVFGEWATSDHDLNRLSPIDDNDNVDQAYQAGFRLDEWKTGIGKVYAKLQQRYTGKRFAFFDRTRQVEFDRTWNIVRAGESRERLTTATVGWIPGEQSQVEIEGGQIDRNQFDSKRLRLSVNTRETNSPRLDYRADGVDSRDKRLRQDGKWFRQQGDVSYDWILPLGTLIPTVGVETEYRAQRNIETDSLLSTSFRFQEYRSGVRYRLGEVEVGALVNYRNDDQALEGAYRPESEGWTQKYLLKWTPSQQFRMDNEVAFRNKKYRNEVGRSRRGVYVHSATEYRLAREFWDGELLYEANTERRASMQETYIEVGPEIGQYVWNDLNDDGIQQVDEFFPEVSPNEGTFIKQWVPSDELMPVIDLNTRFQNTFKPARLWDEDDRAGLKKWLAEIELHSLVEINETSTTQQLQDVYLLHLNTFQDDSLTREGRIFWQQELRLFPEETAYDVRFRASNARRLNQLATGVQRQSNRSYHLEGRYRWGDGYTIKTEAGRSFDKNDYGRFASRNYDITSRFLEGGFNIMFNRSFIAGWSMRWTQKKDRWPDKPVTADLFKIQAHSRAWLFERLQTNVRVDWRSSVISGEPTAWGNYELTEGYGRGRSWTWSVQANYRVSELLRIQLQYDGRTVPHRTPIQTLRIVASALF